eukprot:CAMPEP_0185851188 /NCGR_PEP_ID=MMETSP1354-20130828/7291_1 /TAXON_ID=708628 /ORGANISM="Erythrolobus madagascarensis, Strain CCMP3276" /LENGTH=217 /DNA_ID=CAMNT_0028552113 /DNA_START=222 /DNA_END=875 /DNA_ORIENTATION=+
MTAFCGHSSFVPVASRLSATSFLCSSQASSIKARRERSLPRAARIQMVIGIIYSTTTGNTGEVACVIKQKLGDKAAEPMELNDVSADDWGAYEAVLVGAPTWNTGADEERSGTLWDEFIYGDISSVKIDGKPVGVFGCGDSIAYTDNFCDAIEEMHDCFSKNGAKMIGYVDTAGYEYEESKAVRDGKFLGLPLDQDNEYDKTDDRVAAWCTQILAEI